MSNVKAIIFEIWNGKSFSDKNKFQKQFPSRDKFNLGLDPDLASLTYIQIPLHNFE